MFFTNATFIGVDPTAGQRPFPYAAIDAELRLLALGAGDMDEVLAFIAGQHEAVVAICAPRQPNQGLMRRPEVRDTLSPQPRPGRWLDFRLAEYELRSHNIHIHQTCAEEADCPNWMQQGFALYRRLERLGYTYLPDGEGQRRMLEAYPHACFTVLIGKSPFSKSTLEGRLQRQLVLHNQNVEVPDPMRLFEEITRHRLMNGILPEDGLYSQGELDAIVAAYTAWMAATRPAETLALGDPDEGQIILPVNNLKSHY